MDTGDSSVKTSQPDLNRHLATEVLELGESLFEIALETRSHEATEDGESEAHLDEELRAAADEFFSALRLLLRIEY